MSWIQRKWHSITSGSWRGLSDSDFWNMADAVIATTEQGRGGRGNSFEVWTFGQLIQVSPTLAEAQDSVESVYGPQVWETIHPPKVEVTHVRYGPSTEWTDPVVLHVVRHLPKLI